MLKLYGFNQQKSEIWEGFFLGSQQEKDENGEFDV